MCATCGCGQDEVRVTVVPDHGHHHEHPHHEHPHHEHDDHHEHGTTETIDVERAVLARNDALAAENRTWLAQREVVALNVMSSPGAGKTTLLERTIRDLPAGAVQVVEGDQETTFDADRIRAAGARAVQVNTGAGCHLDASMVRRALDALEPAPRSLVFVENVGNLVCPALFDLGENRKVVVISVTEGDDKPRKYPHMFAAADLVVVNKVDLLPYVDFDLDRLRADASRLHPGVEVLAVSARTGQDLDAWYEWLAASVTLDTSAGPGNRWKQRCTSEPIGGPGN